MFQIPDNVSKHTNVYDVLKERGFIEQTTDDEGIRELLGSGTLLGYQVLPAGYIPNNLVILPPFALILLGCIIWVQRAWDKDLQEK